MHLEERKISFIGGLGFARDFSGFGNRSCFGAWNTAFQ
jgi:hypothetical protein